MAAFGNYVTRFLLSIELTPRMLYALARISWIMPVPDATLLSHRQLLPSIELPMCSAKLGLVSLANIFSLNDFRSQVVIVLIHLSFSIVRK